MEFLIYFFLWGLLFGVVGRMIGGKKSRPEAGFILGLLLGPIGWLIVALGPDHGRKCPACLGSVDQMAIKCRHCGVDLLAAQAPQMLKL